MNDAPQPSLRDQFLWATIAACAFTAIAAAFVYPRVGISFTNSNASAGVAAVIAAPITGGTSWILLSRNFPDRPLFTGALAGLLTGTVGHLVGWTIWSLLPPVMRPDFILLAPKVSLISLETVGVTTAGLAVLVGSGLGIAQRIVHRETT